MHRFYININNELHVRNAIKTLHTMQLQKEVKSNPKHPSCKKKFAAPRMLLWKKMRNSKWWPINGCDGRLKAKISIATIQVNLVLNCSEMWRRQHKFTLLPLVYHHSHLLAITLDFTSFFTTASLGAAHFFTAGLF